MKEVFRILHGTQGSGGSRTLRDYNLTLYEGEIVYVQGLSDSGVTALPGVLTGKAGLTGGRLYVEEKEFLRCGEADFTDAGIFLIAEGQDLAENLSVAENLMVLGTLADIWRPYRRKKLEKEVEDYLEREETVINARSLVYTLRQAERQMLGILKARLHGAKLIVLDCTKGYYEGRAAGELCDLICRIRREGTAFLILSERLSAFARIADRVQIIHHGRDLMEWDHFAPELLQSSEYSDATREEEEMPFFGLYDYEWDTGRNIWDYLKTLKSHNPGFWGRYLDFPLLPDGVCSDGKTVLIPKESASGLLPNMGIRDNIILPIPTRVSGAHYGYIKKSLVNKISEEFFRLAGVDPATDCLGSLGYVERKILSVYRWEIGRPRILFLDSPFWGMDLKDSERFLTYMKHLAGRGVRVLYFSKSLEELKRSCRIVAETENGTRAKIISETTEGKK